MVYVFQCLDILSKISKHNKCSMYYSFFARIDAGWKTSYKTRSPQKNRGEEKKSRKNPAWLHSFSFLFWNDDPSVCPSVCLFVCLSAVQVGLPIFLVSYTTADSSNTNEACWSSSFKTLAASSSSSSSSSSPSLFLARIWLKVGFDGRVWTVKIRKQTF